MPIRIITVIFFITQFHFLFAQKRANIWYFGTSGAGIDFNQTPPAKITTMSNSLGNEGTATTCDTFGNFLFYCDGISVYDSTYTEMPNGDSLKNTSTLGDRTSIQASVIVPVPCNDSLFYVFVTDGSDNSNGDSLSYSIVDMSKNNGKGDVVKRNIKLFGTSKENIAAVHHANGVDVWVAAVKSETAELYAYLVTADSLLGPVISPLMPDSPIIGAGIAPLKFSPNGQWVAFARVQTKLAPSPRYHAPLCRFDNATGIATAHVFIQPNFSYGMSFSSNSNILYGLNSVAGVDYINQYNLLAGGGNSDSIIASRLIVDSNDFTNPQNLWTMQLAPDGKIYFCDQTNGANAGKLGMIINPNIYGSGCNIKQDTFSISPKTHSLGLPNFIESYFDTTKSYIIEPYLQTGFIKSLDSICQGASVNFSNTTSDTSAYMIFEWNFGDDSISNETNPTHLYTDSGTYIITLIANKFCYADTIIDTITVNPLRSFQLQNDTTICKEDSILLFVNLQNVSYLWSTGDTSSIITVNDSGTFWLQTISSEGCAFIDSVHIYKESCDSSSIFIPNAISLSNSINNQVKITGTLISEIIFRIYDHWGNNIFSTDNKNDFWDGTYKGSKINEGVYTYQAQIKFLDGTESEKRGNITVIK